MKFEKCYMLNKQIENSNPFILLLKQIHCPPLAELENELYIVS